MISNGSRIARRKTLSAVEIENFLCDLSSNDTIDSKKQQQQCSVDTENAGPNPCAPSSSSINCNKVNKSEISWTTADVPSSSTAQILPPNPPSLEDHIRTFSRIKSNPGSTYYEMCEIGRDIMKRTNYRIMPSRSMFPEQFPLPAASIEAKKAILISLSPMLTDAESQRQSDVLACEVYTRCKVGKGRGRYSSYEYTDVDVNSVISVKEYEKRYLQYIHHSKRKHTHRLDDITNLSEPIAKILRSAEPSRPTVPESSVQGSQSVDDSFDEEEFDEQCEERPIVAHTGARRKTMSPATVRAMLLLEAQEGEQISNQDFSSALGDDSQLDQDKIREDAVVASLACDFDAILANTENFEVIVERDNSVDECAEEAKGYEVTDTCDAPSPLLSFSPFVKDDDESSSSWVRTERSKARMSLDTDFLDLVMTAPEVAAECTTNEFPECTCAEIIADDQIVDSHSIHEMAQLRLHVRFETIRWKFHWEIASFHAAEAARSKLLARNMM